MPIGIQTFDDIRRDGYVYVDKTVFVYRMASRGKPYFLSRPRRFGKSLFLSTLKAYFMGRKELFEGLAIADMEKKWEEYPVFHLDMNNGDYTTVEDTKSCLRDTLRGLEREWKMETEDESISKRFGSLIQRVCEKTGKPVVILIDEYDKPLLTKIEDGEIDSSILKTLKSFYGTLKTMDRYLRFVFLTGVTKFSHVSVFSDLNQLEDISMQEEFAGVCGITEPELPAVFAPEIHALAEKSGLSYEEAVSELRRRYNGYRFSKSAESVYNPFSVLNTLKRRDFGNYWFGSGTPTFLVKMIQGQTFDISAFQSGFNTTLSSLTDYRVNQANLIPLLYQTGYLTLKNCEGDICTLEFPNEEVEKAFLEELLQGFYEIPLDMKGLLINNFVSDLQKGDLDGFMNRMQVLFEDMPYPVCGRPPKGVKKAELLERVLEYNVQTVFYLLFNLMGRFVQAEAHSIRGRSDAVAVTGDTVYIFEFKLVKGKTGSATAKALAQIDEKGYAEPYKASGKRIVKTGVIYSVKTRRIEKWECASQ